MKFIYYVDGKKYTTNNADNIPWDKISSPDENTPAYEYRLTSEKLCCGKGTIYHRLNGPAFIGSDRSVEFWINNTYYDNIKEWIKDHPNPDFYFHKIGIFTETDKVLWFLQN